PRCEGAHISLTDRPPYPPYCDLHLLHHLAHRLGAIGGFLDVPDSLVAEVSEQDVRWHRDSPLSSTVVIVAALGSSGRNPQFLAETAFSTAGSLAGRSDRFQGPLRCAYEGLNHGRG